MARNYKKVVAWQRAHALTLAVYQLSQRFPDEVRFGLARQIRRCAYSVPSNIAEGSGRETNRDYLHFLIMSRASLKEVEYFLLLAKDLKYIEHADYVRLIETLNNTMRPLAGLINAIRKQTK